jgi:hypothetical protein
LTYDETVSVEELFEEELQALEVQYTRLSESTELGSQKAAESLLHVIAYFRVRLGYEGDDFETVYGSYPDRTIH